MSNSPDSPCLCKSGRLFRDCHLPMLADTFKPAVSREYSFPVPAHITPDAARLYASEMSRVTEFAVNCSPEGPFTITEKSHGPRLQIFPLLRDVQWPNQSALTRGLFKSITSWPTVPQVPIGLSADQAEQQLLATAAEWTPAQLFAIRESFAALLVKPDAASIEASLEGLCTTLRTALPEATIDVLRISPRTISDPLLLRTLTLMPQFEDDSLRQLLGQSVLTPGPSFAFFDPEPHFEVLSSLTYPRVTSFGIRFGSEAYLIVDYGREIRINPSDWDERRARDVGDLNRSRRTGQFAPKSFARFTNPDRHFLRVWLTRRLSYLCAQICHLESALDETSNDLTPSAPLKDILCLRDIAALTGVIATTSDPTVRTLLFFDLIDRYGFLGGRPERPAVQILSTAFFTRVADALDMDLDDYRDTARRYILDAWTRTVDGLWDGVLDPTARANRVLRYTPPGEKSREVRGDEGVSRIIHVLRNTTHGYDLNDDDFERFLIRHTGIVPDSVRELAIGLWLGLMSCPHVFWPPGSRFGRIDRLSALPSDPAQPTSPAGPG